MPDRDPIPALRIAPSREAMLWLSAFEGRSGRSATLLLLGIRDLKQINDLHGRSAGNAVIAAVGERLSQVAASIPGIVLVARMPGREFLLIINHGAQAPLPETLARRLLSAVAGNIGPEGLDIHISARIGIATAPPGQSGEQLLARAGQALASAYARKGKRYALADDKDVKAEAPSALLDKELRAALEKRQIALFLQPQFSIAEDKLTGAEALARWHHPDLGEIGAEHLFAAADRCDLREELSQLVQQQAIEAAAAWPASFDRLRVSINLGADELTDDYTARLFGLLGEYRLPADRLTLELTEESLVRDIDAATQQLQHLRSQGVRIALDDFGTGYSSLAYLKTLPVDYLKLDKALVPDIGGEGKDRIITRAIIAMGKALGVEIIAEGVERETELELLRAEGCDFFQGYLRSPPLLPDAFVRFAAAHI